MITLQQQVGNMPLLEGPIHLDATFYMKAPESISKIKRAALFNKPHLFKPDLDNLIKYICDVSSNLLYHDDCVIAVITAKKVYDEKPRTEFTLRQI